MMIWSTSYNPAQLKRDIHSREIKVMKKCVPAGRQVGTSIGHSYVLALMIGVEAAGCNGALKHPGSLEL